MITPEPRPSSSRPAAPRLGLVLVRALAEALAEELAEKGIHLLELVRVDLAGVAVHHHGDLDHAGRDAFGDTGVTRAFEGAAVDRMLVDLDGDGRLGGGGAGGVQPGEGGGSSEDQAGGVGEPTDAAGEIRGRLFHETAKITRPDYPALSRK